MSQLNIYVPRDISKIIRLEARKSRKSISKYLMDLFFKKQNNKSKWQQDFFKNVVGQWQGDFPSIQRCFPEERGSL